SQSELNAVYWATGNCPSPSNRLRIVHLFYRDGLCIRKRHAFP
ncbi:hypothetical protein CP03DC29_0670B, partial [Chlamydia psittaci 03DC29]